MQTNFDQFIKKQTKSNALQVQVGKIAASQGTEVIFEMCKSLNLVMAASENLQTSFACNIILHEIKLS